MRWDDFNFSTDQEKFPINKSLKQQEINKILTAWETDKASQQNFNNKRLENSGNNVKG